MGICRKIEIVKFLFEITEHPDDEFAFINAIQTEFDNIEILNFLKENNFPFDNRIINFALRSSHRKYIKLLKSYLSFVHHKW